MDDRRGKLIRRAAELKAESAALVAALVMVSEELVGRVAERRQAGIQDGVSGCVGVARRPA